MPLGHILWLIRAPKYAKRPFGVLRVYHEYTPASVSAYNPYGLFVRVKDSLTEFNQKDI